MSRAFHQAWLKLIMRNLICIYDMKFPAFEISFIFSHRIMSYEHEKSVFHKPVQSFYKFKCFVILNNIDIQSKSQI